MNSDETIQNEFEAALLAMDRLTAARLLAEPDHNIPPLQRVERLVVPVLDRIGRAWDQGRIALAQVYMCGRICEDLVDALLPADNGPRKTQPSMAIALLEDSHLLGKRMVYATLRASGYALRDYGRMDTEPLIQRASGDGTQILLISTLMLPSALRVAQVRAGLDRLGCRTRIVVGGAPFRFDETLWREVGADAMGRSASDALSIITRLSGEQA